MKSALLVTYYWPPAGGAGVHRWLRFSKYFESNGWELTVYCPKDAEWPIIDTDLENSVSSAIKIIRTPIFEPQKFLSKKENFNAGSGLGSNKKIGTISKLIIWLRGNLFIPDSRKFWIKPSVRYLSKYLKEHPEITTIISTGPPHSTHLIAQKLKRKFKIQWIADFRDPWTEIDFYKDLMPGKLADNKHKKLEKLVLTEADKVVSVSNDCANGLAKIGQRPVEVITNGYTFPEFDSKQVSLDKKFSLAHFGSMPYARNPEVVWKSLSTLIIEIPKLADHLEIKLVGSVDYKVKESLGNFGLSDYLVEIPQIKHSESIEMQSKTQLLLLVANNSVNVKGILTGKFFEYLGAKRPILVVGQKESDLALEVEKTNCGQFVDYEEVTLATNYIHNCFDHYLEHNLWSESRNIERFSSEFLAKKYIDLLNN